MALWGRLGFTALFSLLHATNYMKKMGEWSSEAVIVEPSFVFAILYVIYS
jgi:hypothetical protein